MLIQSQGSPYIFYPYLLVSTNYKDIYIIYTMRSFWGKLSKSGSNPILQQNEQTISNEPKQLVIDYYQLRQLQQNIKGLVSINSLFEFSNNNIASTFEDVMGTLQGLVNVIQELKLQAQKNSQKINEYDRLKSLVTHHSEIIAHMQQQSTNNLSRIYEEKRQMQNQLQEEIKKLKEQVIQKQQKLKIITVESNQKSQRIKELQTKLQDKNKELVDLSQSLKSKQRKLKEVTSIQDSCIKIENKEHIFGQKIQLQTILVYSKLRRLIFSFIQPKDYCNLQQTNKQIHYICSRNLKKQYIGIMMNHKHNQLLQLQQNTKYYEKIYDSFPAENIKTNAIKYLFYKVKPGSYMLPYFQNQQQLVQKKQEKQKSKLAQLSQLSNFFKKRNEHQANRQKIFTFQSLKNDNDFKETYKKVQTFFDKLFGIEAAQDLKNFNEIMKKQFEQLKTQLRNHQKPMQLLCMSKYLYLQINQLNNLLQVCFALLINKHFDYKEIKRKNQDLIQNDKTLRNLIQNIANDRQQVQRRIFFLENHSLKNKNNQERLQQQVKRLTQFKEEKTSQNQKLILQLKKVRQKAQRCQKQKKQIENKWEEILSTIQQLPFKQ